MEVTLTLTAQEALQATESGALAALIKAAKEQTEVSAAAQTEAPKAETPAPPAAPVAPTWTPGGGTVDDSTPRTPAPAAPAPQAAAETPQATVPTSTKSYTVDEIQRAAIGLMDKGQQAQLMALLEQFGVQALPDLSSDQYGAFALELRQMGAEI